MCVARKSGPGRKYSVAVDWRDCSWAPRIVVQLPVAAPVRLERGCVQSTSRSTLKSSAASGVFQQAGFAKLLRLVPPRRDIAALRGTVCECALTHPVGDKRLPVATPILHPPHCNFFIQHHENHRYEM
jgi:hypothetical protein